MSTAQESFDALRPEIEALADTATMTPFMSTADTVGEGEELLKNCLIDESALLGAGLDGSYITSLQDRIGAYAIAGARYNTVAFAKGEAQDQWLQVEPEALALKKQIVHIMRFAFRRNTMIQEEKSLREITQGRGRRDLMIDLIELNDLAQKHLPLLQTYGMEQELPTKSEAMFETLRPILADINTTPREVDEARLLRNKAYTYLWEAVDAIREFGQFVFWEDPVKLNLYRSDHFQEAGRARHSADETVASASGI